MLFLLACAPESADLGDADPSPVAYFVTEYLCDGSVLPEAFPDSAPLSVVHLMEYATDAGGAVWRQDAAMLFPQGAEPGVARCETWEPVAGAQPVGGRLVYAYQPG